MSLPPQLREHVMATALAEVEAEVHQRGWDGPSVVLVMHEVSLSDDGEIGSTGQIIETLPGWFLALDHCDGDPIEAMRALSHAFDHMPDHIAATAILQENLWGLVLVAESFMVKEVLTVDATPEALFNAALWESIPQPPPSLHPDRQETRLAIMLSMDGHRMALCRYRESDQVEVFGTMPDLTGRLFAALGELARALIKR